MHILQPMLSQIERDLLDRIHSMDTEFIQLTGREAFGHVSAPTDTTRRITFGDGSVHLTMNEAHGYMVRLLDLAKTDPAKLPWPLSERIAPEHDLRS